MSSDLKSLVLRNPILKTVPKFGLFCLADYSGATGMIFPSYDHLAKKMGCCRKTAMNTVEYLISKGYLAKRKRGREVDGKTKNSSNLYRINYDLLMKQADPIKEPTDANNLFPEFNEPVTPPSEHIAPCRESVTPMRESLTPVQGISYTHNSSLNSSLKEATDARAPATLNPMQNALAKAFVAAVVSGEKDKGQFSYVPESEELVQEMAKIDITHQRATLLLGKYGNIRIREVLNMTLAKAKSNPAAYFSQALANDWKPSTGKGVQEAPKDGHRATQIALEEQKRKDEWDAREKIKTSMQANPVALESKMSELRNALKKGRQAGMTAH